MLESKFRSGNVGNRSKLNTLLKNVQENWPGNFLTEFEGKEPDGTKMGTFSSGHPVVGEPGYCSVRLAWQLIYFSLEWITCKKMKWIDTLIILSFYRAHSMTSYLQISARIFFDVIYLIYGKDSSSKWSQSKSFGPMSRLPICYRDNLVCVLTRGILVLYRSWRQH